MSILTMGCASTVTIDRAKAFTESTKDYSENMVKLDAIVVERIVNFTADSLTENAGPLRKKEDLEKAITSIKSINESSAKLVKFYRAIGLYFEELGKLANGSQEESVTKAADSLLGSITKVDGAPEITDEKKSAISGIISQIAIARHSAKLEGQLKKDALPIAGAIALNEKIFNKYATSLGERNDLDKVKLYANGIVGPWIDVSANPTLPGKWKSDFVKYVTPTPTAKLLESGKEANAALASGWEGILKGDYSLSELRLMLKDMTNALDSISKLKNAN
jgi:hypothetical protein